MGNFFAGWRRKTGVLALLFTCLFAAAWLRSRIVGDFVAFSAGWYPMITIISRVGTVEFAWYRECPFRGDPQWSASPIGSGKGNSGAKDSLMYAWAIAEISTGGNVIAQGTSLTIHFWSIVIPLTALSAWLLLSKRREPAESRDHQHA